MKLHRHHVIPRYLNGSDEPTNIIICPPHIHSYFHKVRYGKHGDIRDLKASQLIEGMIPYEDQRSTWGKLGYHFMRAKFTDEEWSEICSSGQRGKKRPDRVDTSYMRSFIDRSKVSERSRKSIKKCQFTVNSNPELKKVTHDKRRATFMERYGKSYELTSPNGEVVTTHDLVKYLSTLGWKSHNIRNLRTRGKALNWGCREIQ